MRLKEILSAHEKYKARNALSKSLGDAYLLKTNPVFRVVREAALEFGYRFTKDRFFDYDVLPLTQLPKILKTKKIPYHDNVSCLKEIEKAVPGVFDFEEVPPLKSNHVLHESAHGIAHELKKIYFKKAKKTKSGLSQTQEKLLQSLVEESFSNSVECLANLYAGQELDDELFTKNSYIHEDADARKALRDAVQLIGFEAAFRLVLLSYLHANFLRTQNGFDEFDRVLKIAYFYDEMPSFDEPQLKILRDAFLVGLDLDPGFTIFTNSFCFRLMGIQENIYEVTDFDFLKPFETEGPYSLWFSVLSALISQAR